MKDEPGKDQTETSAAEYLQQVKGLLAKKKQKEAFLLMQQAHVRYPKEPYILSYYGWLQAVVDKRYRSGIENCAAGLAMLKKHAVKGNDVQYGQIHLNLVRAYLAAGKKKDALDTLQKGLKYEAGNRELHKELDALGKRKKAAVPFLDRANPINKLLGIVRHKMK